MDAQTRKLHELLQLAIARAAPSPGDFKPVPRLYTAGRVAVIAMGKASPAMLSAWLSAADDAGTGNVSALCVAPHGTDFGVLVRDDRVRCLTAGHPVPDGSSVAAGKAALELASELKAADVLIALVSGGGSALVTVPVDGLTLDGLRTESDRLLASGLAIREINQRRRALCRIKGGGLARAASPARVFTYVLSDVPGDDLASVASGPTAWDGGSTVAPFVMTGSAAASLSAAADLARSWGWKVVERGDAIEGEARTVAADDADALVQAHRNGGTTLLLSGGETSVTLSGKAGRGGRNSEYALALLLELERRGVSGWAMAADTDGVDGKGPHAGAWFDPTTLERARGAGLDPQRALAAHDSGSFFEALGQCVETGLTGTNVNDFRAVLLG